MFADGKLLATYDAQGVHFPLTDWLGTKRVQANAAAQLDETCSSLPYGDSLTCQQFNGTDATEHHFTGKERDTETGLDYFGARYFSASMGRFLSADWAEKPEAVPYSDLMDPQSLNLYSYVKSNPLSRVDEDGHCCDVQDVLETIGGAVNAFNQHNGFNFGSQSLPENRLGRAIGNTISLVQGVGEIVGGSGIAAAGAAETLSTAPAAVTGVGAAIPAAVVAATVAGVAIATDGISVASNSVAAFKAGGRFSPKTAAGAKAEAQGKCADCGVETTQSLQSTKGVKRLPTEGTTDHIDPKSKGGTNAPSNARHLCLRYNIRKEIGVLQCSDQNTRSASSAW